ncbi:MAG: hypothetical protein JWO89_1874, partial [Verrucomicrobiaceae bacterium]|nr:hypothetical protein [Verrucomicrobiaceae bacterium]
ILVAQQKQKLGGKVANWFATLPEALAVCDGKALIFHNELLDAFPVDLVQGDGECWQQVWLSRENGHVKEELRPLTLERETYSALQGKPSGRCELQTAVHLWLQGWLPLWREGSMLTVDYGDLYPALYHRKPRGTLRGYLFQQCLTGPDVYQNAGRQDITCDVNFTDVRAWLAANGLNEMFYETQAAFIRRLVSVPNRARDAFIVHEQGAGQAFKCLGVRRSIAGYMK